MKEAIVAPDISVQIVDTPIPDPPTPYHVVVKVAVISCNPKDWKHPEWFNKAHNSGDDFAGTIHSVGSAVKHLFQPGQRVAAFHEILAPSGSFAEYAAAPAHTTFRIPDHVSFEEAATIPLAAATAVVGLFLDLELPEPWAAGGLDGVRGNAAWNPGPLLIYGAAGAVGAFAVKFAKRAGIGPLFCVAGKGIPFVESLLDKSQGDVVVDYREGEEAVVEKLKQAAAALPGSPPIKYAFDAVSVGGTYIVIGKVLGRGGRLNICQPVITEARENIPQSIAIHRTMVTHVHTMHKDFGKAWFALIEQGLANGWLKGHPSQVIPGGLAGLEAGLKDLKAGKASATKYVFRLADTAKL